MKFKWIIVVASVLAVAIFIRFWHLGNLPSILNRDEAALGYNAYLLQNAGVDEWGRAWPITLESFGDQKLIGYPLVLVGVFKIFGATDWSVRLPSALAGVLLIYTSWILLGLLKLNNYSKALAVVFVATSPIFIFFSRVGYEANLALWYLVAGIVLILQNSSSDIWKMWKSGVGGLLILLGAITYNTPLLLLPFLTPLLYLTSKKNKKHFLVNFGIISGIFLGVALLLWPVLSQKSGITIFTDLTVWTNWINWRGSLPEFWQSTLGNRWVYWVFLMIKSALESLSPRFLVLSGGDHPWHQLSGSAHIFWPAYCLSLLGIAFTLIDGVIQRNKMSSYLRLRVALLVTLFLSLIPAVVTVDAPHATRSLLFIFLLLVFCAVGFEKIYQFFISKKGLWAKFASVLFGIFLFTQIFFFGKYIRDYFQILPQSETATYQTGFDKLVSQVESEFPDDQVAVVDPGGYQYILLSWYLKLSPEQYLSTNVRQQADKIGLRYGERVSHYHFIANPSDRSPEERLMIFWDESQLRWRVN